MNVSSDSTWIGTIPGGVAVVRQRAGEESTVDRPGSGRFREPYKAQFQDGPITVDGVPLQRVGELPAGLAAACGWYESADGRMVLLTQIPEPYYGESMVLLAEGDQVVRAYPLDPTRVLGEDGVLVEMVPGGLRLTSGESTTWIRSVVPPCGAEAESWSTSVFERTARYRETEVEFGAARRSAGTVIMPTQVDGDCPAAVFVHGAAGGQRDYCRLLVRPLLDAGVAVLIYDKPGHGLSEGDGEGTIFDRADIASAGLDLLASWAGVDARRIGLVGFSNGMWSVPMLAARRPDVAFVAGIGAPGVSMADSETHRRGKALREAGVGPATVDLAERAWRLIFTIAGTGSASDEQTAALDAMLGQLAGAPDRGAYEIPAYAIQNPQLSALPPLMPVADLIGMITGEPDPELLHDPAEQYARLRCPVLLQYGSDDSNVPVQLSVPRIEAALATSGVLSRIHVYPGLEHQLNVLPTDITGLSPEAILYGYHHFSFGAGVFDDLSGWLRDINSETGDDRSYRSGREESGGMR